MYLIIYNKIREHMLFESEDKNNAYFDVWYAYIKYALHSHYASVDAVSYTHLDVYKRQV